MLSTAYKRPQAMKEGHEWWKYVYDEHYDCVLCPEYQALAYHTTNRDGYREYRSDPKIWVNCPTRHLCTHSKDCVKTMQRHIWKDYEELADDARYMPKYQKLYQRRKETIDEPYMDKLFSDVTSLYRLDQKKQTGMEKADLGPLPKAAVILLSVLGITWIGIILYVTRKFWAKLFVFRHNNH